jgi:hypothetical protein
LVAWLRGALSDLGLDEPPPAQNRETADRA